MDPSFQGGSYNLLKCSKMSVEEKRELVYKLSKWSGASEVLQSWSRQEILQVLCAEMGKERKYTGLTKLKIIDHLLKLVSEKSSQCEAATDLETEAYPSTVQRSAKRQRKTDNPSRLPLQVNYSASNNSASGLGNTVYCKNSACKAMLRQDDAFCKRCSCCICYQYDDNKDPSLWLICGSEPPFQGVACGMSCHLECALKHETSGIGKDRFRGRLDGSFYCVACGKVNDLLGCWRKQLMTAKDTRRVDILCYRISLSYKLLAGTEKYQNLHKIVDEALKKLEADVGPLTGLPVKMGRGIVNRLSSGPEVQKLCAFALETLDSVFSSSILHPLPDCTMQDSGITAQTKVVFEDVSATSVAVVLSSEYPPGSSVVGYTLWHRRTNDADYPTEPACTLLVPNTRFVVKNLSPATEYLFKIVSFDDAMEFGTLEFGTLEVQCSTCSARDEIPKCLERSQSPTTNCSSLSNPSSVEDESDNNAQCSDQILNGEDNYLGYCKSGDSSKPLHLSNSSVKCDGIDGVIAPHVTTLLDDEHTMQLVSSMPNFDVQNLRSKCLPEGQGIEGGSGADTPNPTGLECVPFLGKSDASLLITPCKLEIAKDVQGRLARSKSVNKDESNGTMNGEEPQDGSTSKKRSGERRDAECTANDHSVRDLEYYVKVIRWLECEGHLEKNFRQKFLTWYSLRATPQEIRVVKAFVDTFIEDPASLAEQLVDTFSECVSSRSLCVVPSGFCMKLWH